MIQATKASVVTEFHKDALDVRKMELEFYLMVFDKLSTISSLLAGFASSALMVAIPRRNNPYLVTMFLLSTGSALGSHLLVVIVTTMCTMWGPGYALKGEDAAFVDRACNILETTRMSMERFFIFGLVCYFTSSILVVWLLFDWVGCITVTIILSFIIVLLVCKSMTIYRVLHSYPTKTSSEMKFDRVKNIGHLMGDATGTLTAEGGVSASFATKI